MDLTLAPERLAALAATLSADEQVRAARFRFAEHRDRFSAGRGLLRELLGGYVQRPAATLRFAQGAQGKPHLVGEAAGALHFNLSHSGERALYAVARREVGVDINFPSHELSGLLDAKQKHNFAIDLQTGRIL